MTVGTDHLEQLVDILFDDSGMLVKRNGDAGEAASHRGQCIIDPGAVEDALGRPERVRLRLLSEGSNHTAWRVEFGQLEDPLQEQVRGAIQRAFDSAASAVTIVDGVAELRAPKRGVGVVRSTGRKHHYTWMNTFKTRLQKILIEDCRIAAEQLDIGRFEHMIPYGLRFPPSAEEDQE